MESLIISCEHGGNEIPKSYQAFFEGKEELLASHRGWDIGALEVAKTLSESLNVELHYATTSRLLVELNRSLHHPHLFSQISKPLPRKKKSEILDAHYFLYRNRLMTAIEKEINNKKEVLHLSVHSFTPELAGIIRSTDIGLLFDPLRKSEKKFCKKWKAEIKQSSILKVRYNYPYKGTADGFTTFLRKQFHENYRGIELEINQQLLMNSESKDFVINTLISSLKRSI